MGSPWQPDDPNPHGECAHEIDALNKRIERAKELLEAGAPQMAINVLNGLPE